MNIDSRSWLEISLSSLRHNYLEFRRLIRKNRKLLVVVKSNAYGHGMVECAKYFEKLGADYLGVDSLQEALVLRKARVKVNILVLGFTRPEDFVTASRSGVCLTLSNIYQLKYLDKLRVSRSRIKVHIKVDTGLHRQGFTRDELEILYSRLSDEVFLKKVEVVGLYSHFASAENEKDKKYTLSQVKEFIKVADRFGELDVRPIRHLAATSGGLDYPESYFDMVRLGIGAYGLYPTRYEQVKIKLKLAMLWKSIVGDVHTVKSGSFVGYDLTAKLERDSVLAIVPVGYWHGYPWRLSNSFFVMIGGKKSPIIGRVSMDMMVVDVTDISNVKTGDEVILLGGGITAEEVAHAAGSFNYEFVTRINPLLERKYY